MKPSLPAGCWTVEEVGDVLEKLAEPPSVTEKFSHHVSVVDGEWKLEDPEWWYK